MNAVMKLSSRMEICFNQYRLHWFFLIRYDKCLTKRQKKNGNKNNKYTKSITIVQLHTRHNHPTKIFNFQRLRKERRKQTKNNRKVPTCTNKYKFGLNQRADIRKHLCIRNLNADLSVYWRRVKRNAQKKTQPKKKFNQTNIQQAKKPKFNVWRWGEREKKKTFE